VALFSASSGHPPDLIGSVTSCDGTQNPQAPRLVLIYDAAITAAKVGRGAGLVREASVKAQELLPARDAEG